MSARLPPQVWHFLALRPSGSIASRTDADVAGLAGLRHAEKAKPSADTFTTARRCDSATLTGTSFVAGSVMTIEPAREVRRATSSETGWYAAGALLVAAGVATAVSVLRQWSLCDSTPPSQACVTLRATMNMLPIQADTIALRVP